MRRGARKTEITLVTPSVAWQLRRPFSKTNLMAYAVFKTGGKQYRVAEGDTISVEKLDGEPGAEITFSEVLCTGGGSDVALASGVQNATVVAEVVEQHKGEKV